MDATLIVIDSDAELARARALVERLWGSDDPSDVARSDAAAWQPSRVSEVLRGKRGLSMAMVQRLRARFRVPADLLLPPPTKASARGRAAA